MDAEIKYINKRNIFFLFFAAISILMFYVPLREIISSSLRSDYYDHIILIPFVSAFFIFLRRKEIFSNVYYSYRIGIPIIIIGLVLYYAGRNFEIHLNQNDYSSIMTLSALIFIIGAFIILYGIQAFKAASFPLLFLIFMIPIPTFIMDKIIHVLLVGSVAASDLLFKITGTAYIREGASFHLPGISVMVADVCSGIRSSLALFITMVIAAHLFLRTTWKKGVLLLAIYPVTVFKNGVRIVTITMLATYVDERFLTQSFLHHSGGFLFFIPSLALLGLLLWFLRRSEPATSNQRESQS
jgi:exosortase